MKITFMIGNGFDLNLGLKTTYNAFLESYRKITDEDSDLLRYFKSEILSEKGLWSNVEEAFGCITKRFKDDGRDAEDYCECHEHFCVKLAEYLMNEEQKIECADIKSKMGEYLASGLLEYKNSFRENERNQIGAEEQYIGNALVFNFINFNYTKTLDIAVNTLRTNKNLLGQRRYGNTTYQNSIGTLMHVHGTLHKDMVLGVNDISQIADHTLFDGYEDIYISQIIKQKTNEINGENIDRKVLELLKGSDIIYIYGMSTGSTDQLWWKRVCDVMKENNRTHLIIHKYNAPEERLIRRRSILFDNAERKSFLKYSDFDDEVKQDLITRIHIDKSNIFEDLGQYVIEKIK